jgi:hypothetical protein
MVTDATEDGRRYPVAAVRFKVGVLTRETTAGDTEMFVPFTYTV